MSKMLINLSYKNAQIVKHALQNSIEAKIGSSLSYPNSKEYQEELRVLRLIENEVNIFKEKNNIQRKRSGLT